MIWDGVKRCWNVSQENCVFKPFFLFSEAWKQNAFDSKWIELDWKSVETCQMRTVFWSRFFSFQKFASKMHFILNDLKWTEKNLKRASGDLCFRAGFFFFRHVEAKCIWFSSKWFEMEVKGLVTGELCSEAVFSLFRCLQAKCISFYTSEMGWKSAHCWNVLQETCIFEPFFVFSDVSKQNALDSQLFEMGWKCA